MAWTNSSRNTASFLNFLRHANSTRLAELANFTFNDVIFADGTILKNVTFDQLVDQVWANVSKSASPTFTNATRN